VNFAVYLGEEKTLIYKRGQGIVLNEPSVIARVGGRTVAYGRAALKYLNVDGVTFNSPIYRSCIQSTAEAAAFIAEMCKKVHGIVECLFCIPSCLTTAELNDYKTAIYSSGINDAAFVPVTVASAFGFGYEITNKQPVLSVVTEGEFADITVIRGGEIIDGGALYDMAMLDAEHGIMADKYPNIIEFTGDRKSIIFGAGRMLDNPDVIKRVVKLN
jgi:rod shape-determining protein MreB